MVDFGSCDRSDALQVVWESAKDCLSVYGIDYTDIPFLFYRGSVRRNKDMWRNTEMGVVIYGRIRTFYLCSTYTPIFTNSLVLVNVREQTKCEL